MIPLSSSLDEILVEDSDDVAADVDPIDTCEDDVDVDSTDACEYASVDSTDASEDVDSADACEDVSVDSADASEDVDSTDACVDVEDVVSPSSQHLYLKHGNLNGKSFNLICQN